MRGSSPRMTSWRARTSLLLLQVKFADARRHVIERLRDHLLELARRRRHRDGARLLDHRAVLAEPTIVAIWRCRRSRIGWGVRERAPTPSQRNRKSSPRRA